MTTYRIIDDGRHLPPQAKAGAMTGVITCRLREGKAGAMSGEPSDRALLVAYRCLCDSDRYGDSERVAIAAAKLLPEYVKLAHAIDACWSRRWGRGEVAE